MSSLSSSWSVGAFGSFYRMQDVLGSTDVESREDVQSEVVKIPVIVLDKERPPVVVHVGKASYVVRFGEIVYAYMGSSAFIGGGLSTMPKYVLYGFGPYMKSYAPEVLDNAMRLRSSYDNRFIYVNVGISRKEIETTVAKVGDSLFVCLFFGWKKEILFSFTLLFWIWHSWMLLVFQVL